MATNPANRRSSRQRLLTPPPRELQKALEKAAGDAQRLADAFGQKVPVAPRRKD